MVVYDFLSQPDNSRHKAFPQGKYWSLCKARLHTLCFSEIFCFKLKLFTHLSFAGIQQKNSTLLSAANGTAGDSEACLREIFKEISERKRTAFRIPQCRANVVYPGSPHIEKHSPCSWISKLNKKQEQWGKFTHWKQSTHSEVSHCSNNNWALQMPCEVCLIAQHTVTTVLSAH